MNYSNVHVHDLSFYSLQFKIGVHFLKTEYLELLTPIQIIIGNFMAWNLDFDRLEKVLKKIATQAKFLQSTKILFSL